MRAQPQLRSGRVPDQATRGEDPAYVWRVRGGDEARPEESRPAQVPDSLATVTKAVGLKLRLKYLVLGLAALLLIAFVAPVAHGADWILIGMILLALALVPWLGNALYEYERDRKDSE